MTGRDGRQTLAGDHVVDSAVEEETPARDAENQKGRNVPAPPGAQNRRDRSREELTADGQEAEKDRRSRQHHPPPRRQDHRVRPDQQERDDSGRGDEAGRNQSGDHLIRRYRKQCELFGIEVLVEGEDDDRERHPGDEGEEGHPSHVAGQRLGAFRLEPRAVSRWAVASHTPSQLRRMRAIGSPNLRWTSARTPFQVRRAFSPASRRTTTSRPVSFLQRRR